MAHLHSFTADGFKPGFSHSREFIGSDYQRMINNTLSQNFDRMIWGFNNAGGDQLFWRYLTTRFKDVEFVYVNNAVFSSEDIDEAALSWQALN
jgi:hypothetical protein